MAGPVQWVTSRCGSEQVNAAIMAITGGGVGALPGLRLPSRSRRSTALGVIPLLSPHRGPADLGPAPPPKPAAGRPRGERLPISPR
jgi:hypothetical protein